MNTTGTVLKLSLKGLPVYVLPEHIVYIFQSSAGTTKISLSNRQALDVDESAELILSLMGMPQQPRVGQRGVFRTLKPIEGGKHG